MREDHPAERGDDRRGRARAEAGDAHRGPPRQPAHDADDRVGEEAGAVADDPARTLVRPRRSELGCRCESTR